MLSTCLNSTGLLIDIIGVIIVWKFGLPDSINRDGLEAITTSKVDQSEIARAKKYDWFSKFGLSFLILGFAFQLAANLVK